MNEIKQDTNNTAEQQANQTPQQDVKQQTGQTPPVQTEKELNAQILAAEFTWLESLILARVGHFVENRKGEPVLPEVPQLTEGQTPYSRFVTEHSLTPQERIIILLALAPELKPSLLDDFLVKNTTYDIFFSEFGGITEPDFKGFLPTHRTALFLLGGPGLEDQMKWAHLLNQKSPLFTRGILKPDLSEKNIPSSGKRIELTEEAYTGILTGEQIHYEYSADFPARRLTTPMEWQDLILHGSTDKNLQELLAWPRHGRRLIEELEMGKNIRPGYRALFYGPSGTGKTLTASLLGKKVGKTVYRIDLSQLVSKYIGETEKNLERIFTASEHRDWILFFDEADALFGKRTSIGSSNDRFANQETAYLLQRIEESDNIVILATNLKGNLDQAFTRRFQSVIHFPMPTPEERLKIWQGALTDKVILDDRIDLKKIAEDYDISGGSIINVIRYASVMAVSKGRVFLSHDHFLEGIRREYAKLGRTF